MFWKLSGLYILLTVFHPENWFGGRQAGVASIVCMAIQGGSKLPPPLDEILDDIVSMSL